MLNVSDATKLAWSKDGSHKEYTVVFPELNLTIPNNKIVKDSMSLSESLCSGSNIEFIGCISSSLKIKIYNLNEKIKGKKIELYAQADNTEIIPLFKGIVDSATIQAERAFKEIVAYDVLYTAGQREIASWYNSISYPTTLGAIRNSLFSLLGINVVQETLPNDILVIPEKKFENVESMKALTVIKSICQANGVFGIIDRYGNFAFRKPVAAFDMLFPGDDVFPGDDLIPVANGEARGVGYFGYDGYKSIEYEEYFITPVERIQIRDNEDDPGVTYGSSGNKYIIQSNMFFFELEDSAILDAERRMADYVGAVSYHPSKIECLGLPFVECGDIVSYPITRHFGEEGNYDISTFVVMSRTLKGSQLLFDSFESEGEEEQSEFLTDIQSQLQSMKMTEPHMDDYYTKDETADLIDSYDFLDVPQADYMFDDKITQLETPTGFNVVSCYTVPGIREPNTIYLIQGGVVML